MNWIEGIGFLVAVSGLIAGWLFLRKIKKMDAKSTDELQALVSRPNQIMLYGPAIKELEKRGADYTMAFPHLIDGAVSKKKMDRLFAWGWIETYFPEVAKGVDYNIDRPSKEAKAFLKGLKG